jgi:hypothetical protein
MHVLRAKFLNIYVWGGSLTQSGSTQQKVCMHAGVYPCNAAQQAHM